MPYPMDSANLSIKIPLKIYSSYILSHCSVIFHSASHNFVGNLFDSYTKRMMPAYVSAITSLETYLSRTYFTASQYDDTVPCFWHLWYFYLTSMGALSPVVMDCFIKTRNKHRAAHSCLLFVLHTSLKAERKLKTKIVSEESDTCNFIWTCERLAHFAKLLMTSSPYRYDFSAMHYIV